MREVAAPSHGPEFDLRETAAEGRRRRAPHVATFVLAALVLTSASVLRIDERDRVIMPVLDRELPAVCAVWRTKGQPCAGCGLTRAFIDLAHGNWHRAATRHVFAPALFLLALIQIPLQLGQLARLARGQRPWPMERWSLAVLLAIIAGMYLSWLAG